MRWSLQHADEIDKRTQRGGKVATVRHLLHGATGQPLPGQVDHVQRRLGFARRGAARTQ
jgi:hypothetical protein